MISTEEWTLPAGTRLMLRAARADDAPALQGMIEGLSRADRRWRFHGAIAGLPAAELERMVASDARQLALVVVTPGPHGEQLIAEARCVASETVDAAAEFALAVAAPWRRCGVGFRVLHALQRAAWGRGWRRLFGSVLADNAPMLALMRSCGFDREPDAFERSLVHVTATLHPPVPFVLLEHHAH
ncbi:MAG: GNAT family N-acetyltransferase [Burkholderiales bacterium]|nr:GNAT family N-acetyltransferase [Burkholderiales bacterium]